MSRTLGTSLLLLYMLVVALAGLTREIRPSFLDGVHRTSARAVRLLGMSAGQPLFQTQSGPWKHHAFCLRVRTDSGDVLFPPGGECQVEGFHPRLPPVDRATHRMLSAAWRSSRSGRTAASDAYSEAIGRAFCLSAPGRPATIQTLWTWYYKHYDDGSVLRRNGVLFEYECARARLTTLEWEPDDAAVRAFWGDPQWR